MKKLKDFIYDKNDIIIAALILAAAALIIAWRMDVILQYPKELINADDPAVEEPIGGGTQPDDTNTGDKPADNTGADNNDNSGTTAAIIRIPLSLPSFGLTASFQKMWKWMSREQRLRLPFSA